MDRREPPPTEEGWYALHDLRTVDWDAWRGASDRDRERALREAADFLASAEAVDDADAGDSALYAVAGHEADLMVLHLRPALADVELLERRFDRTAFAGFTDRADSYVSVTEASGYTERARGYFEGDVDDDSGLARYIESRLHPEIPDVEHVSFYPMDKRRDPEQNWYDLPFDERAEHMDSHGDIGRDYAGRVTQMITGSVGLDDREWGVTLWADDLTDVKDLLYEMRFDPSTSRYAEFGSFVVGRRFPPRDLGAYLAGEPVPADGGDHGGSGAAGAGDDGGSRAEGAGDDAGASVSTHGATAAGRRGGPSETSAERADGDVSVTAQADGDRAGEDTDGEAGSVESGSGSDPGRSQSGGPPESVASGGDAESVATVDDADQRLASFGIYPDEYDEGDHALLCYVDADAEDVVDDVAGLRENFEHYDTHVLTSVRADAGRAAVVSVWSAERAADTALGFLRDVAGVSQSVHGRLGDAATDSEDGESEEGGASGADGDDESGEAPGGSEGGPADADAADASVDAASIREELAERGVYAGQPHGEDVYAMVLYSWADVDELAAAVEDLREGFDRYDTHVRTSVYDDPDAETAAVVSLWDTERAADTAGDFLTDLPEIVGRPADRDGFGTMGMFYTVQPDYREEFVETFEAVGEQLDEMDGHRESALLVNADDENDMFVASRWDAKDDAMAFFRSEEFRDTVEWGREVLADRPRHVFLA